MAEKMLKMLGPYILMRRDKPEERLSPGGVVMPKKSGDTPTWGTAVAVGGEASLSVVVGDRLLVGRYAGNDVQVGEESLVVVRLEDVYGVDQAAPPPTPPKSING